MNSLPNLGRKPISRYHASEMNAKSNEFKGWTPTESLFNLPSGYCL